MVKLNSGRNPTQYLEGSCLHSKLAALQEQARRRHSSAPPIEPAPAPVEPRAFPKFRTTSEVAEILRVSQKSVIREFEGGLGVIDNGSPRIPTETDPRTKYRRLVIPEEAIWQYLAEHRSV
jgi:hypothetical protein